MGITAACAFVGMVSPHAERLSDTVLHKPSEVNVTPSANIDDDDDDDDEVSPPTMSSVAATSSGEVEEADADEAEIEAEEEFV